MQPIEQTGGAVMIEPPIEGERGSYILGVSEPHSKMVNAPFIEVYPFRDSASLSCEVDQGMYSESTSVRLTPAEMRELAGLLVKLANEIEGINATD